jgi:uncharacterized membrane protein (UPF0127 family)
MLVNLSRPSLVAIILLFAFCLTACAKPDLIVNKPNEDSKLYIGDSKNPDTDFDNMTDEQVDAWLESDVDDDRIELSIGLTNIRVEYANTPEKRQLGLMFRRQLCENCGMLFKFDGEKQASIWMKNTYIPLDLAYIDTQGRIVDIKYLQAHDLRSVKSSSLVLYALEMNSGWFAKQDIRVGDLVTNLP